MLCPYGLAFTYPSQGASSGARWLKMPRPRIVGLAAQRLLDPQELVELGYAVGAGRRARLDLAGVGGDGEVGDGHVFRLTAAVGDHCGPRGPLGEVDRLQRLRERADLLSLIRIELAARLSMARPSRAGLVTSKSSPTSCTRSPSRCWRSTHPPQSSLGEAVLDRLDGVPGGPVGPELHHFGARKHAALAGEMILAVLV